MELAEWAAGAEAGTLGASERRKRKFEEPPSPSIAGFDGLTGYVPGKRLAAVTKALGSASRGSRGMPATPSTADLGSPASAQTPGSCRYDSSLGLLTKKFLNLVESSQGGVLDLNKAAEQLAVKKRRIYDITNVMEGIGLIEKKSKNQIQWKGMGGASSVEGRSDVLTLKREVESLHQEELKFDEHIKTLKESMQSMLDDPEAGSKLYITTDDIQSLPCFADNTLVAIKSPKGTTVEVPDPEEGMEYPIKRFQIFLRSASGPIKVLLVKSQEQQMEQIPPEHEQQRVAGMLSPARGGAAGVGPGSAVPSPLRPLPLSAAALPSPIPLPIPSPAGHGQALDGMRSVEIASPSVLRILQPASDDDLFFSPASKDGECALADLFPASVNGVDVDTLNKFFSGFI
mmetsp:Transcript_9884/g.32374  ORF Transcript_9884/g.32374 Transcript_9884/m.32374 type:complete len:401 (-) Transcript_9884:879-2081(-)